MIDEGRFNNSKIKKYDYCKLTDRFGSAKNPKVFLIDMKLDRNRLISKKTIAILKEKINKGKQILILINKLNINTKSVLDAAKTKWNFLNFRPGLVLSLIHI